VPTAKATTVVSEVVVMHGPLSRSDVAKRSAMAPPELAPESEAEDGEEDDGHDGGSTRLS
jgi:hypothetical protein